jgi:hypothetical protein
MGLSGTGRPPGHRNRPYSESISTGWSLWLLMGDLNAKVMFVSVFQLSWKKWRHLYNSPKSWYSSLDRKQVSGDLFKIHQGAGRAKGG